MKDPASPEDPHAEWEEGTNPTISTATGVHARRAAVPVLPFILAALVIGVAAGLVATACTMPRPRRKSYERSIRKAGEAVRDAIEPRRQELLDQLARVRSTAENAVSRLPHPGRNACETPIEKFKSWISWN